jgi:DNA-binding HxlR family transcriptional regulator
MVIKESSSIVTRQEHDYECPDDYECSIEKALDAIGGKWSFLILRELLHGAKRFGELKRAIHGISPKSLAATLHHLEDHHVITRTVHPTNPPMVEYALTDKGEALRPIIYAMKSWGKHWA